MAECRETFATVAPAFDPAPELAWPSSRLVVSARVPTAQIVKEIEKRVPEQLARDRQQEVGAAGRATYSVRRLRPRLEARGGNLEVQVPLEAVVDVCKPFGRTCIRYGHCEPAFLATFRVPSSLDKEYRVGAPRGTLEATRRCVIGIDVTPQILREAQKELSAVERQLERALPELAPEVGSLWRVAQEPHRLSDDVCLRFEPSTLAHTPGKLESGGLEMSFMVGGKLVLDDCAKVKPTALPALETRRGDIQPSELWVPNSIPFHELGAAIEQQLASAGKELTAIEVTAHGKRVGFRLGVVGESCGDVWLSAGLDFHAPAGELRLVDVKVEAPQEGPGASVGEEMAQAVQALRLPVVNASEPSLELLRTWMRKAQGSVEGLEVQLAMGPATQGRARVHAQGIALTAAHDVQAGILADRLLEGR